MDVYSIVTWDYSKSQLNYSIFISIILYFIIYDIDINYFRNIFYILENFNSLILYLYINCISFFKKIPSGVREIFIENVEEDVVEERNDVHGGNGTSPPQKASIYLRGLST